MKKPKIPTKFLTKPNKFTYVPIYIFGLMFTLALIAAILPAFAPIEYDPTPVPNSDLPTITRATSTGTATETPRRPPTPLPSATPIPPSRPPDRPNEQGSADYQRHLGANQLIPTFV